MFQPVGQPNTKQMLTRLRSGLGRLASHVEGLHWASTDDSPDGGRDDAQDAELGIAQRFGQRWRRALA